MKRREFIQQVGMAAATLAVIPRISPRISMPNPAVRELLDKRVLTAKHFELGDGSFLGNFHIGHIHFPTGALKDGTLDDIDTTLNYNAVSKSYQMTSASYEAEVGLYGGVRFHNVDHFIEFRLPNPNKVQATAYSGSEFGRLGKGLIWRDILQDGGHQIVEARNGSLAKIFHFDKTPVSSTIEFLVEGSSGIKMSNGISDFNLANRVEIIKSRQGRFGSLYRQSFIRQPRAWNHRHESVDTELRFRLVGGKVLCQKIIPRSFIDGTFTEPGAWLEADTTTSFYAGSGDGWVQNSNANFSACRDASSGTDGQSTTDATYNCACTFVDGPVYAISRHHFPCDTSTIGASAIVTACIMNIYYTAGAGLQRGYLVLSTQASVTALVAADYSAFGGNAGTTYLNISPGYNGFTVSTGNINKTGYTKLGVKHSKDYLGSGASEYNDFAGRFSEYTGAGSDPYLSVTYATSSGKRKPPPTIVIY